METFLYTVASSLVARGWQNLANTTLIFPMQRAGLFMKEHLKQMMQEQDLTYPVVLPRMLTIDQWVDSLSPLRADDEVRSVCRLYQLYKQATGSSLTLDAFYGWGQQLLQDFSNADMALQDMEHLMQHTADAAVLDQLNIDDETRQRLVHLLGKEGDENEGVSAFFRQLWQILPTLATRFRQLQQTDGVGSKGARYRAVIDAWDSLSPATDNRCYVFVGFNYLLAAERQLMRLLRQRTSGECLFFWDNDPTFTLDPGVYKFIRENIAEFGNNLPLPPQSPTSKPYSLLPTTSSLVHAISCSSSAAQAQYVNRWLREHHHSGEHTAIVIADEAQLEPVVYALPANIQDNINITKGYPLRNTKVYAEVVSWLRNTHNDRRENETYADVLRRLSAHLMQKHQPTEGATWQDILREESYYQAETVIRRLQMLAQDAIILDEIGELRTLRAIVRRALEAVSIPFHGEPITHIQIIGVLETRLLDFDNVLVLNVEEGVVPNMATDRSFIPYDLRKLYHMQTRDEEAKIYAYNFFRLLRRAGHVTLLFSEAATDMGKKQMSRFLMQMLTSDDFHIERARLEEKALLPNTPLISTNNVPSLASTLNTQPSTLNRQPSIVNSQLSPSALGDYVECPRMFYLTHIRHIRPTEGRTKMLSTSEIGSLIHGTIEAAYRTIISTTQSSVITPKAIDAFLSSRHITLHEQLQAAYAEMNKSYHKRHPEADKDECPYVLEEHPVENAVAVRTARAMLRYDKKEKYLEIREMEKYFSRQFLLHTSAGDVTIALGGTVDRLDSIEQDGQRYLRILDYKTGSFDATKFQVNKLDELFTDHTKRYFLQTLLYSCIQAAQEQTQMEPNLPIMPQLLFTRHLQQTDAKAEHLLIDNMPLIDYSRQAAATFEKLLNDTLTEIATATSFPMADPKICESSHSYCPFHDLCGRKKKKW